jgi:hypothetical protein
MAVREPVLPRSGLAAIPLPITLDGLSMITEPVLLSSTPVLQKAVKHFSPLRHNDWEMYIKNCTGEIEYHTACHIDCRLDLLFSSSTTPTAIPLPNPSLSPALS